MHRDEPPKRNPVIARIEEFKQAAKWEKNDQPRLKPKEQRTHRQIAPPGMAGAQPRSQEVLRHENEKLRKLQESKKAFDKPGSLSEIFNRHKKL